MVHTTFEEFESEQEDEVNLDDPESVKQAYHELLSNPSILSKAYKSLSKDFKKLSKDHIELEKAFQDKVDVTLDESTQTCDAYETLKVKSISSVQRMKESPKKKPVLLEKFQELKNKLKLCKKN